MLSTQCPQRGSLEQGGWGPARSKATAEKVSRAPGHRQRRPPLLFLLNDVPDLQPTLLTEDLEHHLHICLISHSLFKTVVPPQRDSKMLRRGLYHSVPGSTWGTGSWDLPVSLGPRIHLEHWVWDPPGALGPGIHLEHWAPGSACITGSQDPPGALGPGIRLEHWAPGSACSAGPLQPSLGPHMTFTCTAPRERFLLFPEGGSMIAAVFKVRTAGIRQQKMAKLPPLQDLHASHVGSLPEPDLKCGRGLSAVPLKDAGHSTRHPVCPGVPGNAGPPATPLSFRSSVPPE